MRVVGPWIWLQATSASAIAMFRDAATMQADKTPKTSETPPIAQCSASLYAAKAEYLAGIFAKAPGFLIAHAPWKTQPHWWKQPCRKPKSDAFAIRPRSPRCGSAHKADAATVTPPSERPAIRRARASTSVVMRLLRTHASASASDAGDGGGAGMVAAVEAVLDPVVRRGQDPLRLVEICIGCVVRSRRCDPHRCECEC